MGACGSVDRLSHFSKADTQRIRQIISAEEMLLLHLIYRDLADRIPQHKINQENFLLFFQKNGLWGERLFREFDADETGLVSEAEFICGIARIFKSSHRDKISLLYKFFAKNSHKHEGVFFNQFLTMLYNYPKQDLQAILSHDKEFLETGLKEHLVRVEGQAAPTYRLESNILPTSLSAPSLNVATQSETQAPSMIGKDIMKHLKTKKDKIIRLGQGQDTIDVQTINIQQLVKKYAQKIFSEAGIDQTTGRLTFEQFQHWISTHQSLYQNYYHGFHHLVWEVQSRERQPMYLTSVPQKTSEAIYLLYPDLKNDQLEQEEEPQPIKSQLFLHHSVLVVAYSSRPQSPIDIVCLDGLAVRRCYEQKYGYGVQISHSHRTYHQKKIFFKDQGLLMQWMEHLRFYRGETAQQKYDIGEKIGTGKFSLVYRCRHNQEGIEYAIKQIATYKLQSQARQLIAHQSSIMQVISHPLLLEFRQCIQSPTHIYIVTQLVKGRDLFDYVKQRGRLAQIQAARILQQVIVGIRFLHSFDIIHRDLKPENIMVVADEDEKVSTIKVIDFGFSNYLSKIEQAGQGENLVGTPNYIAPEVLLEEPYDFKIDNFAIGVILFFMLTGALPFNDYSVPAILTNTLQGRIQFPPNLDLLPLARDLTCRMLANDPKERISLQQALKHPWFHALQINQ